MLLLLSCTRNHMSMVKRDLARATAEICLEKEENEKQTLLE